MRTIFSFLILIVSLSPILTETNWIRPDKCSLPLEKGINENITDSESEGASVERFYFNPESEKCESFGWKGWSENENNFHSKPECQIACDPSSINVTKPLRCYQKFAKNGNGLIMCLAFFPKWSYDLESSECKQFTYGGCGGNENSFDTHEECDLTCNHPVDHQTDPIIALLHYFSQNKQNN